MEYNWNICTHVLCPNTRRVRCSHPASHSQAHGNQCVCCVCVRARNEPSKMCSSWNIWVSISAQCVCVCVHAWVYGQLSQPKILCCISIEMEKKGSYLYIVTVSIYFYYYYMELFCAQMVNANVICQSHSVRGTRNEGTSRKATNKKTNSTTHTHTHNCLVCKFTITTNIQSKQILRQTFFPHFWLTLFLLAERFGSSNCCLLAVFVAIDMIECGISWGRKVVFTWKSDGIGNVGLPTSTNHRRSLLLR